ncbi:hypothetical protein [Planktothrix phage Pra-JY27]|nr:portal-adaptor protein [Planktothrix phage Pag-Yong1]WEV89194.1 hypothetical protein [Synechococcus phage MinM2]
MPALTIWEIIEEAYERIQIVPHAGYDFRSAKRSLDLLRDEWANRGLHLWSIEERPYAVAAGANEIILDAEAHDLLDAVIRDPLAAVPFDLELDRMSLSDWLSLPFKDIRARPTRYAVRRQIDRVVVVLWQTPDRPYQLRVNQLRVLSPSGAFDATAGIPIRFQEAMIAGLAAKLAVKRAPQRLAEMRALYEEAFQLAADEDRDRSGFVVRPEISR